MDYQVTSDPRKETFQCLCVLLTFLILVIADGTSVRCTVPASQSTSELCCQKQGRSLPHLSTTNELRSVINTMTQERWVAVWLGLRRRISASWYWVDGSAVGVSLHGINGKCGYFNNMENKTFRAPCNEKSQGFVCQRKDCGLCEAVDVNYDYCKKHSDSCFLYYCKRTNWLNARHYCRKQKNDLAVTKNNETFLEQIRNGCMSLWIGASKETWAREGSNATSKEGLWGDGEPSEKGNCSILKWVENDYVIHAENCDVHYPSVCIVSPDHGTSTWATTVSVTSQSFGYQNKDVPDGNSLITIVCSVLIPAALIFIGALVVYFIYKKKQRVPPTTDEALSVTSTPESRPLLEIEGVAELREKIARMIIRKYNRIRLCSMNEKDDILKLDKIYTTLFFKAVGDKTEEFQGYQMILENLKEMISGSYVLVYGEPGSGKTTLTKRIPIDWAQTVLNKQKDTSYISRYTLVIPIFLRHIKNKVTFTDIVLKTFALTEDEIKIFSALFEKNSESILIVCDGYDECSSENCSEIINLFKGKRQSLNAIVMSRDSGFLPLDNTSELPDITFRLIGFSKANEYIQRFFANRSEEQGEGLLMEIKETDKTYLKHLCRNPAILFFICDMWRKQRLSTKDITKFYMDLTIYILVRYELKYIEAENRATQETIIGRYKDELFKLGRFAIENLKDEGHIGECTRSQVKKSIEDAWAFGFLKCTSEGRDPKVSFLDEHIPVFLAALYIVNSKISTEKYKSRFQSLTHFDIFRKSKEVVIGNNNIFEES